LSGYKVVIEELREAGRSAISAGEQAGTVDLGGTLSGMPGALPGSRSVQAAAGLANSWQSQIKGWSGEAATLGRNMTAAADYYAANEQAAEDDLTASGRGLRAE
jgi:hypothetical protein